MENQTVNVAVSSVISANNPLEPSYVWVTPTRARGRGGCAEENDDVRSVNDFENYCNEIFQEANVSERLDDPQIGEIVCVMYRKRWVRAEVHTISDQFLKVLLLDYGGVHKLPLSRCRRIPDGISIPKVIWFISFYCYFGFRRDVRRSVVLISLYFSDLDCDEILLG